MIKRNKIFLLMVIAALLLCAVGGCVLQKSTEANDDSTENDAGDVIAQSNNGQQNTAVEYDKTVIPKLKDGLYGFVNYQNEWVIEPKYGKVKGLSDGYFAVGIVSDEMQNRINTELSDEIEEGEDLQDYVDTWGYVDKYGSVSIEPKYYEAGSFSNGLAFVREKQPDEDTGNIKGYYINYDGDKIIALDDNVMGFAFEDNQTAIVHKVDEKDLSISLSAVIDSEGNYVIPFSKELTFIGLVKYGYRSASPKDRISSNQDTGVIDSSGNWVIEPKYSYINILYLNRVLVTDKNKINKIIDMSNTVIAKFRDGNIYTGNYDYVIYNESFNQEAKLILFDSQGKQMLDNKHYKNIVAVNENTVYASDGNTGMLLSLDGLNLAGEDDVTYAYMVNKNLANVGVLRGGKYLCGLLDVNTGKWVLEPVYSRIISCMNGCGAAVRIVNESDNGVTYVLDAFDYNGQVVNVSKEETVSVDKLLGLFTNANEYTD